MGGSWSGSTCTLDNSYTLPAGDIIRIHKDITLTINAEFLHKGEIINLGTFTTSTAIILQFSTGPINSYGTFNINGTLRKQRRHYQHARSFTTLSTTAHSPTTAPSPTKASSSMEHGRHHSSTKAPSPTMAFSSTTPTKTKVTSSTTANSPTSSTSST